MGRSVPFVAACEVTVLRNRSLKHCASNVSSRRLRRASSELTCTRKLTRRYCSGGCAELLSRRSDLRITLKRKSQKRTRDRRRTRSNSKTRRRAALRDSPVRAAGVHLHGLGCWVHGCRLQSLRLAHDRSVTWRRPATRLGLRSTSKAKRRARAPRGRVAGTTLTTNTRRDARHPRDTNG